MNTDDALKKFFSEREEVPQTLRAQTLARLAENEAAAPSRWVWGVVAFDFLISAAVLCAVWVLFGQGIVAFSATVFTGMSLVAVIAAAGLHTFERRIAWDCSFSE